jgi:PAS domain S-box-containing protein
VFLSDKDISVVLFKESPTPIAIVGLDGIFIDVNDAWSKMLGYSTTELNQKMSFREITHPQDLPPDEEMLTNQLKSIDSTGYSMVKRYITKQGNVIWVNLVVFNMREELSNKIRYFVAYATPLPNGGKFKIEKVDDKIHVRPTISFQQFIKDNWRWFLGVIFPSLGVLVYYLFKVAIILSKVLDKLEIPW